jgi:hypothetical protein
MNTKSGNDELDEERLRKTKEELQARIAEVEKETRG